MEWGFAEGNGAELWVQFPHLVASSLCSPKPSGGVWNCRSHSQTHRTVKASQVQCVHLIDVKRLEEQMRWKAKEKRVEPCLGRGWRTPLAFWVAGRGRVYGLALLSTLQQEAESVLAQQDNWSSGSQASRAGQVSWVGQGVCVHGELGLAPPCLVPATLSPSDQQP